MLPRFVRELLGRWRERRYWQRRWHFNYYKEVIRLAQQYAPTGGQVIDVGAYESDVLSRLSWFDRRVALDLYPIRPRPGIEAVQADFMKYQPETYFDLVLCLQVLEHLEAPDAFAQKLLRTGRVIIISVPYKWPEGSCPNHVQDPVDEAKLERWTGREPVEMRIVVDDAERLIAVYQN